MLIAEEAPKENLHAYYPMPNMTKNDFSVLALFLFPLYYLGKFKESTQFEEKYKWELNASTKIEETSEENEIAKANSHHHGRIQPAGKKILKNKQHIFARGIKKANDKKKETDL